MAYAATVTRSTKRVGGQTYHIVTVTETGVVDATHVYSVPQLPIVGTVVHKRVTLTPGDGTATTVDPQIGETSGGAEVWENGAAAATVRDDASDAYVNTDGTVYGKSAANGSTGTTGSIASVFTVLEGRIS